MVPDNINLYLTGINFKVSWYRYCVSFQNKKLENGNGSRIFQCEIFSARKRMVIVFISWGVLLLIFEASTTDFAVNSQMVSWGQTVLDLCTFLHSKVLKHPPYCLDLSPCDFYVWSIERITKMTPIQSDYEIEIVSSNKYVMLYNRCMCLY